MGTIEIKSLTAEALQAMSCNELISIVKETNRPPGGIRSLARIARHTLLGPHKSLLEIGTSTGFTAIELACLTGAKIWAIDINAMSLEEARTRAALYGVSDRIRFEQHDAVALPYEDASFDVVFCGNVTSLISDSKRALSEYVRVLKPGGFLAAIPMYYLREPSWQLLQRVREAIQVNVQPLYRDYWMRFFGVDLLRMYLAEDFAFDELKTTDVDEYVQSILQRSHLDQLEDRARTTLNEVYSEYMQLFRENLAHMGFTILLLRKDLCCMDPELFTARQVSPT